MTSQQQIHGFLSAQVTKYRGKRVYKKQLACMVHNLLTNAGRDFYHSQGIVATAAGNTKGANQIAVTESTITPAVGDTTLTGEVTTNGLPRTPTAAGTVTHSNGTNSSLVEHTFTATGAFTDVKASAIFNADATGTMTHIANFATGSGTLATNDTLKVSWTINIG